MGDTLGSLDKWRDYFKSAGRNIFDVIEHAIIVAASDCPCEFKRKRDLIAEMLFSCKMTKCFGCNTMELSVPDGDCLENIDDSDKCKSGVEVGDSKDTKDSKANNSRDEEEVDHDHKEVMDKNVDQHRYEYSGALPDDEESQILEEVLRIKKIVDNSEEKHDELIDSLKKLQLMPMSFEILKETKIGKSVNALRKHGSKEIQKLVRTLIEDWRLIVDAAATALADEEGTTKSGKTSIVQKEEKRLPSPSLREGAFPTTSTSMELSPQHAKFFAGMYVDGTPRNNGEFNKCWENGKRQEPERTNQPIHKFISPDDSNTPKFGNKRNQESTFVSWNDSSTPPKAGNKRNQESTMKKEALPCKSYGPSRPKPPSSNPGSERAKLVVQPNIGNGIKTRQNNMIQKKPIPHQREMSNCDDHEASINMKLEASKRKLQERYKEVENGKKRRRTQLVDLHDLPKQSFAQMNPQTRQLNNHTQPAQGRPLTSLKIRLKVKS